MRRLILLLGVALLAYWMIRRRRRLGGSTSHGSEQGPGTSRRGVDPRGIEEAYAVLGLEPGASRDEVVAAHRRLIQKMHPDQGGSDYLAAKVNGARDLLLGATASAKGPRAPGG